MAASDNRIRLDLNSPEFQEVFFRLPTGDLRQVAAALQRLRKLSWSDLLRHPGFRWEAIRHLSPASGPTVHSMRLSQRIRAIAIRDGEFLRLLSLHPDHDSAYR